MVFSARVWSQAEQERVRRLAVAAVVEQGMSVAGVGRVFGVSRQTVSGWVNGFRRQGELALAAGLRGRRAGGAAGVAALDAGAAGADDPWP